MNSCNVNYESQYALYDMMFVEASDYTSDMAGEITCAAGHGLIYVNCTKRKSHFRHNNPGDVGGKPMTKWHCEWQGNFEMTEVPFDKLDGSFKERRADAVAGTTILEFQHSAIDRASVDGRRHDYELHGRKIIWIVDGNARTEITRLDSYDRRFLVFSEPWIYKSFISYERIFINVGELIYTVYPGSVKGGMIDVDKPREKYDFIRCLKDNIAPLMNTFVPKQSTLYIKQQGAGNGKTFGIVQMIDSDDFAHYTQLIMITKQHSAKYIMFKEFIDQFKGGLLKNIGNPQSDVVNKKFVITYDDLRNGSKKSVIIATVDSLMYSLGDHSRKGVDKFEELVNSVIDGSADDMDSIKYAGLQVRLDKNLCLIYDETQDLAQNYGMALIRIMRNRYVDSYVVGDKLQSICFENNAFTYLCMSDIPNTRKIDYGKTNVCRRFKNRVLSDFVNCIVKFNDYDLPNIELAHEDDRAESPLNIFYRASKYSETDNRSVAEDVEQIMGYFEREVEINNRVPEDFLIVTPFTQDNPLVNALEARINVFWREKYDGEAYLKYAYFHKSQEGMSIDLAESEKSTRIVSIHACKGDGRKVVFVIGISESALKLFDKNTAGNGLVYESLLHVAITRMKEKLYIRLNGYPDDIYERFKGFAPPHVRPPYISTCMNISGISTSVSSNVFKLFMDNFGPEDFEAGDDDNKRIIDMRHHNIRYYTMEIQFWLQMRNEFDLLNPKKQIVTIFNKLIKRGVISFASNNCRQNYSEYMNALIAVKSNEMDLKERFDPIPFFKLSDKGRVYNRYYELILLCAEVVIKKLKHILDGTIEEDICPYEAVVLAYMISVHDRGVRTDITMMDLYNIIDVYNNAFVDIPGHDRCICKGLRDASLKSNNVDVSGLSEYIRGHYDYISTYRAMLCEFKASHPSLNYLMNYPYSLSNRNYKIFTRAKAIAYNDEKIFVFEFKPQVNALNIGSIKIESIIKTFLIKNAPPATNDEVKQDRYKKFRDKSVVSVVLSMKAPIIDDWTQPTDRISQNNELIKNTIRNFMLLKLTDGTSALYEYLCQLSQNKKYSVRDLAAVCITNLFAVEEKVPEFIRDIFKRIIRLKDISQITKYEFDKIRVDVITDSVDEFIYDTCSRLHDAAEEDAE